MRSSVLLFLLSLGCAATPSAKLAAWLSSGCFNVGECLSLVEEAKRLHQECLAPGDASCNDSRVSLVYAMDLLHIQRAIEAGKLSKVSAAKEAKTQKLKQEREEARFEIQQGELAAWKAQRAERKLEEARQALSKLAAEDKARLAGYAKLSPEKRLSFLSACYRQNHEPGLPERSCGELILDLLAVCATTAEAEKLLALGDEKVAKKAPSKDTKSLPAEPKSSPAEPKSSPAEAKPLPPESE